MKAFVCERQDRGSVLVEVVLPRPLPKPDQIVVSVRAAGVTPTELLWYAITHNKDGSPRVGAVPGHEFSGVVSAIGNVSLDFGLATKFWG